MIDFDKLIGKYIICNNYKEFLLFKKYFHFQILFEEAITDYSINLWLIPYYEVGFKIDWCTLSDTVGDNNIQIKDFVRQLKLNKIND